MWGVGRSEGKREGEEEKRDFCSHFTGRHIVNDTLPVENDKKTGLNEKNLTHKSKSKQAFL